MARYVVVAVVVVVVNQALPCGVPVFWTVIVGWSEQWWVRQRERERERVPKLIVVSEPQHLFVTLAPPPSQVVDGVRFASTRLLVLSE
jgi:hypothetical protein